MEGKLRLIVVYIFCVLFIHGHINTPTQSDIGRPIRKDLVVDLLNEFPSCEIWIFKKSGIASEMLMWISSMNKPIYFISLKETNSSLPRMRKTKRFSQNHCSLIITFCESQHICQGINGLSTVLSRMNKILLFKRQMILFLQKEMANRDERILPQQMTQGPRANLLDDVNNAFAPLGAHITLVRKWNHSMGMRHTGEAYHLLTWTPNWFPGGTPFLFDTWTQGEGFYFRNRLNIDVGHIKQNAAIRFCVPAFYMRPIFKPSRRNVRNLVGTQARFIKNFVAKLGLNASMHESLEKEYGKLLPNGNWTGAIGSVIRKESDVAAGHLIFNSQRRDAKTLFGPWDSILSGVVVCSKPAPLPVGLRLFMPLEPDVWAYIVSTFFVTLIFAKLVERFIRKFLRPILIWSRDWYAPPKVKMESVKWHYVLAPLFSEPIPSKIIPIRVGFLILIGSWFIFSYLITIFFSSGLVGFLLSIPLEPKIVSMLDLVERNEDPWFITKLVRETIVDSEYDVERHLLEFQHQLRETPETAMELELEGYLYIKNSIDNCLIAEEIRSKYYLPQFLTQGGVPELYVAKVPFFLGTSGWFLRSDMDFILQEYMTKFAANYHSAGLFTRNLYHVKNGTPEYKLYEALVNQPKINSLSFSHLEIVFLAFAFSLTLATVVFLAEVFWTHWNRMRDKYCVVVAKKPTWQVACERICLSVMVNLVLIHPIGLTGLFLQMYKSELYFNTLLSNPEDTWALIFTAILNHAIGLTVSIGFLPIFIYFFIFVYMSIALLQELRTGRQNYVTKETFRSLPIVLHTYRSLQVLLHDFNDVVSQFFQILLNNMIISTTVLCIFVVVRFHQKLELGSALVFASGIICGITFILVTYLKFGEINSSSKSLIRSWICYQGFENREERQLMIKYLRSFQTLKVQLGGFGYYNKPNSIRMIGKMVYYAAKFLLMTKQFQ